MSLEIPFDPYLLPARVLAPDEGKTLRVLTDRMRVVLDSDATEGRLALLEVESPAGAGVPLHAHANEDEVFRVLAGVYEFTVGDEVVRAGPGTTVFAPRGALHGYRAPGPASARMLVTVTPGGLEGMFVLLDRLGRAGALDQAALRRVTARFGVHFAPAAAHAA